MQKKHKKSCTQATSLARLERTSFPTTRCGREAGENPGNQIRKRENGELSTSTIDIQNSALVRRRKAGYLRRVMRHSGISNKTGENKTRTSPGPNLYGHANPCASTSGSSNAQA